MIASPRNSHPITMSMGPWFVSQDASNSGGSCSAMIFPCYEKELQLDQWSGLGARQGMIPMANQSMEQKVGGSRATMSF